LAEAGETKHADFAEFMAHSLGVAIAIERIRGRTDCTATAAVGCGCGSVGSGRRTASYLSLSAGWVLDLLDFDENGNGKWLNQFRDARQTSEASSHPHLVPFSFLEFEWLISHLNLIQI